MNCRTAIDLLMEADPQVLSGLGDDPLAEHVRTCPRCGAATAAMLAAADSLRDVLATARPIASADQALDRARWRRRARRRWWFAAGPALAAAGIGGLWFLSDHAPVPLPPPTPTAEVKPELPLVTPPAGHNVAVFHTDDPNIVIVWIL